MCFYLEQRHWLTTCYVPTNRVVTYTKDQDRHIVLLIKVQQVSWHGSACRTAGVELPAFPAAVQFPILALTLSPFLAFMQPFSLALHCTLLLLPCYCCNLRSQIPWHQHVTCHVKRQSTTCIFNYVDGSIMNQSAINQSINQSACSLPLHTNGTALHFLLLEQYLWYSMTSHYDSP